MNKSIFIDKKILFYGPANTIDKNTLDINSFDYIIITNNMINIFFNKYGDNLSCKIIHLTNQLYTLIYIDIIKKYSNNIDIFFVVDKRSHEHIRKYVKNPIYICQFNNINNMIKKKPFGLTRILNFINDVNFKELYISGVTFYMGNTIEDCYEKNYMIKEGKKYNIFKKDKHVHDKLSNINYTKKICDSNKNISMCKELKDILCNINI